MNHIPGTVKKESRYCIWVRGTVQGVGFRPFIYRLANSLKLRGVVFNCAGGVCIEAEGDTGKLEMLIHAIKNTPPPLARIEELTYQVLPLSGYSEFTIKESGTSKREREGLLPPDSTLCSDCTRDIRNSSGRFYLYPFTNCINCGPRFTISRELPYDRKATSMGEFIMCRRCSNDYSNPVNRRFHAQPTCCPLCGPQITLVDSRGNHVAGTPSRTACKTEKEKMVSFRSPDFLSSHPAGSWRDAVWDVLIKGKIVAVKSIGGFHLICNAADANSVKDLRCRKGRESKPFALMCRDLRTVEKYCVAGKTEKELLGSPAAPIVLLRKNNVTGPDLPEELAPNLKTLGVMLPYAPLHKLLLDGPLDILVMTSGNYSDLPLVKDNACALTELTTLTDYLLLHNRDIINRCDDSVVKVVDGEVHFLRRSRGYVPSPVRVPGRPGNDHSRTRRKAVVLGAGGDMKSVFCLLRGREAFLSQHLGSLNSVESVESYRESLANFKRMLRVNAEIIGYDLHPSYLSSRNARNIPGEHIPVQHHHAHMASCLAENCYEGDAIGVILDGTGYGTDGNLWGFEIFTGNFNSFRRRFHLAYMPLPGGEEAVRNPWMTAATALIFFCKDRGLSASAELFPDKKTHVHLISRLIKAKNMPVPLSCGCGRLFDAVSAMTGICTANSYEGQAAVELGGFVDDRAETEAFADNENAVFGDSYRFSLRGGVIDPAGIFTGIINDIGNGCSREEIALRFHRTVVCIVTETVTLTSQETGLSTAALSGGCWHNRYLLLTVRKLLKARGFKVLYHHRVPAGDGGISLGQAMIAGSVSGANKF